MSLPTQPQTRASINVKPQQARVLLAGTPKAGKTSLLAGWAPSTTLIIDTQHGTDLLDGEHFVVHVANWSQFVGVVNDLCRGGHHYLTVGIDLIDDIWTYADAHFAGKGAPLASATNDYQKSLKTAEGLFRQEVGRLLSSSLGVWFLSHTDEKQDGNITRYVPKLDKRVLSWVQGATQFVFLAESLGAGGRRALHTQPSASFEAGSRVPMPEPMALDARELWLAMDRGLNPHLYTPEAVAARRAAKDDPDSDPEAPANEAPAPVVGESVPEVPVTPPTPILRDVKQTGTSDLPVDDPWFAEVKPLLKGIPSDGLRAAVTAAGGSVPANVSSWQRTICALDTEQRARFVGHLSALGGDPWAGNPDPDPAAVPDDDSPAVDDPGGQLDMAEARAEA